MSDTLWTVGAGEAGVRLDKFLAAPGRVGSRARASAALERGKVFVNGVEAGMRAAGTRLAAGDVVRLWIDRPGSGTRRQALGAARTLEIVFEDDALVVLNKPPGLLAVPLAARKDAPSVYYELARYLRTRRSPGSPKRSMRRREGGRPLIVHRIDRDTSGLVVFAKRLDAQQRLKEQFTRHEPERVYQAVVYGRPSPPAGRWHDLLAWDANALLQREAHPREARAKDAISEYRVIEAFADAALIEVRLVTGKRNQIRIQARLRGHALVGERLYATGQPHPIAFPRQALHAYRLAFTHPLTGEPLAFEAPLPADLSALVDRLRRSRSR